MAEADEIARRYFQALNDHDLDAATACWAPGAIDRLVGQDDLIAPAGVRDYFERLFAAFPDFSLEVLETTGGAERVAIRWTARATFAGPGDFEGLEPNGAQMQIEGCDVMTVADGLIRRNEAYLDSGDIARQLGFLPAAGSVAGERLTKVANLATRVRKRVQAAEPERIADGVWLIRGGFPAKTMNVYLLEDEGGVTVFDAGIEDMAAPIQAAGARLGGINRVVLGHADADHRGAAPGLGAPVYCHEGERNAAESPDPFRSYWHYEDLEPPGAWLIPRLVPMWDGGAVEIAGTVAEGDEIAGFRVVELPGHAPGLIGLFRERDGVALVSDCFYTLDLRTGMRGDPRVPHRSTNLSTEQAAESIRKLAGLAPSVAWAGHVNPVTGDVVSQLHQAAVRS